MTPETEQARLPAKARAGGSVRVMFIDDDEDSRELVSQLLVAAGFEVTGFSNAEDALASIDGVRPEVVVTDLTLPGLDGHELAVRIKSDPQTARIPVVAVTGLWPTRSKDEDPKGPFHAFLVKPISPQKLVSVIRDLASPTTEAQRHHSIA